MPILDVEIVGQVSNQSGLAQRLADAAGQALNSKPHSTWVKLRFLESANYAENDATVEYQPVFVDLLLASPPKGAARRSQTTRLTEAIATVLNRPAQVVHITFQPSALGRISFGGELQE